MTTHHLDEYVSKSILNAFAATTVSRNIALRISGACRLTTDIVRTRLSLFSPGHPTPLYCLFTRKVVQQSLAVYVLAATAQD